ncbi:MAG: ferrochelatase [Rhodospirillales bacterium]|nr:ferrochelatase [Rhodospirillales bacterium]MCB9997007.1 ferrochelatase [Rhodospirillales bacterium]
MTEKTAIILFNLGGPDKPDSIRPFLLNFFMDKNIIHLPYPLRWMISRLIANRRSKREAGDSYALLGGKSPLLENTQDQANALQAKLGDDHKVFVCMRYWHPMADEVARKVKDYDPARIILLPLYPQYSTTTTRSSFQSWDKAAEAAGLTVPGERVCCYPFHDGFIAASADHVTAAYKQAQKELAEKDLPAPRVLFSAHGLPEDIVKAGDPYQWQCERCAEKIAAATGIEDLDWQICYQSRVGPKKWIGPSTDEALRQAAADKVPVLIYPHAFVSEHVETLVEIEIEYRHLAEQEGVPYFARVPTVGTHEAYIDALAQLVKNPQVQKICPRSCGDCGHT